MDIEKLFGNLTEEQIAMAKQCKDPGEFLKLAGAEGIDLTEDQMDALSGGVSWTEKPANQSEGDANAENCGAYCPK